VKISIVYIHPASAGEHFTDLAVRFVDSYNQFPPGVTHNTIIALNDTKPTAEIACLFSSLPNVTLMERSNAGYDCGGYQDAAARFPADLMVFFGASSYLRKPNWLAMMALAYVQNGDGLYGVMGHRGNMACRVHPHIRTTGFWCSASLMNNYPHRITRADQRYGFEHGPECLTNWVKSQRLGVWVVDARGKVYDEPHWDEVPGGMHKGNQDGLMCGDRHTCPPFHPVP